VKGSDTNDIFTRYTTDGTTWGPFMNQGGATPNRIDMVAFGGNLYQNVRGESGNMFSRKTNNAP
jgi:hypothetical protein